MSKNYRFLPIVGLGRTLILLGAVFSIVISYFYTNDYVEWLKQEINNWDYIKENDSVAALSKTILVVVVSFWILLMLVFFILPVLLIKKRTTLLIIAIVWLILLLIPVVLLTLNIVARGGVQTEKTTFAILNTVMAMWTLFIFVGALLTIISVSKLKSGNEITFFGRVK